MLQTLRSVFLGDATDDQVPERIRHAIGAYQESAEILIGWLQLCVFFFFMLLYTLAPKPEAPILASGGMLTPVPYVLAVFFLFTTLRLFLAYQRLLPNWFLVGSVVLDLSLLMVLIWCFHIQYQQSPPFYLKAPTLIYVFIFIALRTLRFDPKYVVVAGITAAAGWSTLVWYALYHTTDPATGTPIDPVTRDYVEYLNSNVVLLGAEVDKILAILLVTAVLAVALSRARRLLMRAIADSTVARDLTRFVAPEVATRIAQADRDIRPGDGEVTEATVMFCDIEGFSTISERLAPDVLMQTLNAYFDACAEVIERNEGVINQFQGDAMIVTFNTVRADPNHASNALKTAVDIQTLTNERRFGPGLILKTRCGINTGQLVSGAVGTDNRLIFTIYGDEVNVAARLEQLNKSYGTYILATEKTVTAAGHPFVGEAIGSVQVRGRQTPVNVFSIQSPPPVLTA